MVNIANLTIIDTGYLRADAAGLVQATRANSGTAIELKAIDINLQDAGNVDTEPIVNSNSSPVINFGSVSAGKITINGVLNRTVSADMDLLRALRDLRKTYGVKLLYYSSITDGYDTILGEIGYDNKDDWHKATFFSDTATPHLHVKFTNFSIRQLGSSHLRYTLECVETA